METETKILTEELKERCLDFAKRLIFKGPWHITDARRKKLWSDAEWFLTDALEEGNTGWEAGTKDDTFPACDWFSERFEQYIPSTEKWYRKYPDEEPKYYHQLNVVCRIAFDVIDGFPGGVWGFTIGDIKRMYDGELPVWFDTGDWMKMGNGMVDIIKLPDEASLCI
ncbi:hypothetical protein ES703_13705 [subsurface metagenome]